MKYLKNILVALFSSILKIAIFSMNLLITILPIALAIFSLYCAVDSGNSPIAIVFICTFFVSFLATVYVFSLGRINSRELITE